MLRQPSTSTQTLVTPTEQSSQLSHGPVICSSDVFTYHIHILIKVSSIKHLGGLTVVDRCELFLKPRNRLSLGLFCLSGLLRIRLCPTGPYSEPMFRTRIDDDLCINVRLGRQDLLCLSYLVNLHDPIVVSYCNRQISLDILDILRHADIADMSTKDSVYQRSTLRSLGIRVIVRELHSV